VHHDPAINEVETAVQAMKPARITTSKDFDDELRSLVRECLRARDLNAGDRSGAGGGAE
jgi:hypothetical protein